MESHVESELDVRSVATRRTPNQPPPNRTASGPSTDRAIGGFRLCEMKLDRYFYRSNNRETRIISIEIDEIDIDIDIENREVGVGVGVRFGGS